MGRGAGRGEPVKPSSETNAEDLLEDAETYAVRLLGLAVRVANSGETDDEDLPKIARAGDELVIALREARRILRRARGRGGDDDA